MLIKLQDTKFNVIELVDSSELLDRYLSAWEPDTEHMRSLNQR